MRPSCDIVLMKVIGPHAEEGEGEGTDIVAFANTSVDVFKEVLDSLRKRSVWQCSQHCRSGSEQGNG